MRRRAGLALMVIAALSAAGCGGSAGAGTRTTAERDGAVAGTLWMIGGPAPGHRRLRNAGIRVLAGDRVVATTTSDRHGRFHVMLAPGRYELALAQSDGLLLPRHVDVAADATARIRVTLSVK
jgi:hypothetical protein